MRSSICSLLRRECSGKASNAFGVNADHAIDDELQTRRPTPSFGKWAKSECQFRRLPTFIISLTGDSGILSRARSIISAMQQQAPDDECCPVAPLAQETVIPCGQRIGCIAAANHGRNASSRAMIAA